MELIGVIFPHDVADEEFVKGLENLAELSRVSLENRQAQSEEVPEGQIEMEEVGK